MKYHITAYKSPFGVQEVIDLPDQSYGEWIVYENHVPKYHVACFRENSDSDKLIYDLLESGKWSMEKIISRINSLEKQNLKLFSRPIFAKKLSSVIVNRDEFPTLPAEWVKRLKSHT
ncbi:MAG: hypothetical protein GC178_00075 [Flavobacteriales bacterium]|nr:hypothetical protein [Flavobacteriales bacterium]